ncbi:MAG: hypothetical protein A3B23_00515 [Candidatus Colwellbacteria bacterium RIFCSPLOWO2_01_FULL_48_10]|uniref:Uncharacterized protein n=1 Tax=Candidatus Colwellbacteria bacterium RIFCSPLOWO2_01_FULL_48_10 TaxID=1797690 RepID=A0A1G1Z641_9BACT|nr:MAG: hypothetical protein A3B23_00515 [Candidatus Colwellbacteria bacterium RIFCSPLOWO2_01_FULL_48_10]
MPISFERKGDLKLSILSEVEGYSLDKLGMLDFLVSLCSEKIGRCPDFPLKHRLSKELSLLKVIGV